jgi:4-hydroxy-tetrahydrodipicolinate reductase
MQLDVHEVPKHPSPSMIKDRLMTQTGTSLARLALIGARGRMGSRIDALAASDGALHIACRATRGGLQGHADRGEIDVIIDFSSEAGTRQAIQIAKSSGAALLVGTTGLPTEVRLELEALACTNAVLVAPNTSLGVAVTRKLARLAAELLGPSGWSVDIVESHHERKKDAPSGTALAIAHSLGEGGMNVDSERIHAIRAGDTIGEHEIRFAGPSERIHLMHQAVSRDLFAAGALRAAKWLAGRPAGLYTMDDVLG